MIIFGSSFSPFVRKTLTYLNERGIAHENVPTILGDPNPDFRAASPFGKMPAIKHGDFAIADSTAIITYLEAKFPGSTLMPTSPEDRARTVWFEEVADTMLAPLVFGTFGNRIVKPLFVQIPGDLAEADRVEREDLPRVLDYLEGVVPGETGFLVGDGLTIGDIAIACMFANFLMADVTLDPARWPRTIAFANRILARPSMAALYERDRAILAKIQGKAAAG